MAYTAVLAGFQSDTRQFPDDGALIKVGLVAWNKEDSRGRACVSCHSPQGLELAFYNFSDEDIVRRALAHVTQSEAQDIVGMVHARRREYRVYQPMDPMLVRPLQPGGKVLPGATPAERDFAFAQEVDRRLPLLTRGEIDSLGKAKQAAKEVLAIELKSLPVGFEFNRMSEDGFHGSEHAIIADWIPDVPVKLTRDAIYCRDEYQRNPSSQNLTQLEANIPKDLSRGAIGDDLALIKYRSLLLLQAYLTASRHAERSPNQPVDNPFWDLAEFARGAQRVPLLQMGLPEDIRVKKEGGPPLFDQFLAMKLPWYWMGWISDPTLFHTRLSRKDRRGDYFGFTLFDDGPYPMHCAFMFFRKQMDTAFEPGVWDSAAKRHYELEYSTFLLNQNFLRFAPKNPAESLLYKKFVVNAFRTSLFLLLDQTRQTNRTGPQFQELSQARVMVDFVENERPKSKMSMEKLLAQIERAFSSAKEVP